MIEHHNAKKDNYFLSSRLPLLGRPVATEDACVVTLKGIKSHLFLRPELIKLQLLHFAREHGLDRLGEVDTVCLVTKRTIRSP